MLKEGSLENLGIVCNKIAKKEQDMASVLQEKVSADEYDQKTLDYLLAEGVLELVDSKVVIDWGKYENISSNKYLGKKDGKNIMATRKRMEAIFSDISIVVKFSEEEVEMSSLAEAGLFQQMEEVKQKLLDKLEVAEIYKKEGEWQVIDMQKFSDKHLGDFVLGKVGGRTIRSSRQDVFTLLSDMKVISREDYEESLSTGSDLEAKSLFNVPESADEAFDLESIKNKEYYLNVWDIAKTKGRRGGLWNKKIKAKNDEDISMNELYLATEIFRNYKGERKNVAQAGEQLEVLDPESGKMHKLTYDWIDKNLGLLRQYRGSVQEYLREKCPTLLEKNLLKLRDFEVISSGASGKLLRKEFLPGKKQVSINSVQYYIGRDNFIFEDDEIPMQNIKVVVLDQERAGLVVMHEGREDLKYTFDLLSDAEIQEKREAIGSKLGAVASASHISANMYVNKGELESRLERFSVNDVINKKSEETDDDFETRRRNVADYGYVNKVTERFSAEAGIGIHNLAWQEQVWLAAASYDLGVKNKFDDLLEFAKEHQENGLKTFLSLESGEMRGVDILKIAETLETEAGLANQLFAEYARIVDGLKKDMQALGEMYNQIFFDRPIDQNKVSNAILGRACDLLKSASSELEGSDGEGKKSLVSDLILDLRQQEKIQKKILENLKNLFETQNNRYKELIASSYYSGFKPEEEVKSRKEIAEAEEIYKQKVKRDFPDDYEERLAEVDEEKNLYSKFDSQRLQEEIERLELGKNSVEATSQYLLESKGSEFADSYRRAVEEELNEKAPYLKKLKLLLQFQKDLEEKLDQFVYSDKAGDVSSSALNKYQEIVDSIKEKSRNKVVSLLAGKRDLSETELDSVVDGLLEQANAFLSEQVEKIIEGEQVDVGIFEKEIARIDAKVLLLAQIVKSLPREDVANLDLRGLKDIERRENIPAKEILEDEELLAKILPVIEEQFPAGDKEAFLQACSENKDLELTVTVAGGEVLSFFSRLDCGGKVKELDWFIANPKATIKGLGEATAKLEFSNPEHKDNMYYAVAKPHVKSFEILIEKFGFTAFEGSTDDEEYKHHYTRCRKMPGDEHLSSKNLSSEHEELLKSSLQELCKKPEKVDTLLFGGYAYHVAKVEYCGQSYKDDVNQADDGGWIMQEIDKQKNKNYILSRWIPESNEKGNQVYYAVFEKKQTRDEDDESFVHTIKHYPLEGDNSDHSTSKKALSI